MPKKGQVMYQRLCNGLSDKGKLIPFGEDVHKHVNEEKDFYLSLFHYNEDQKKVFDKIGSISGITDVTTNKVIFDFDCQEDINKAKIDTKTLVGRLQDHGISEDDMNIYFSGNKGFHVFLETEDTYTPKELKNIAKSLAEDLETFDGSIYNASRVVRVPQTKHQKTGLYSTPLLLSELDLSVRELKELAANSFDVVESKKITHLPSSLIKQKEDKKSKEILQELNLSDKPKYLSSWKYALSQGYFPEGTRNNALTILAATYKGLKFDKINCYYLLKGAADHQSRKFKTERMEKEEISNIVDSVYSDTWNGGTYSEENFPLDLQKYLEKDLGIPRKSEEDLQVFSTLDSMFSDYKNFAINIDKNTIKTGIAPLDKNLRITTSMLVGLLGAPSSGKCHGKGTRILMYDGSIKNVEDVKVGDLLMGNDSTPRKVLSLARGREELFKVHTDNGYYTANRSHILSIKNTQKKTISGVKYGEYLNISIHEYLQLSKDAKRRLRGYRAELIEFPYKKPTITPYLVGAWIGDGTFKHPVITNADEELYPYLKTQANKNKLDFRVRENKSDKCNSLIFTTGRSVKENLFRTYINTECRDKDGKRIPKELLINSKEVRRELLAGIIDTDGYYDKRVDKFEVTFKEKKLAEDLQFLCRSLGLKCTLVETEKGIASTGFKGIYYRMYLSGDFSEVPIKLSRRVPENREHRGEVNTYSFELESLGEQDYYGFELDGNHLYCLGDFTVTHNTSTCLEIIRNTSMNGENVAFFSMDMGKPLLFTRIAQKVSGFGQETLARIYKENREEEIKKLKYKVNNSYQNVNFSFKTALTVKDIRESVEYQERVTGKKIRLVVVDYLECITSSIADPTAKISTISQELKDMANDLETCVLLLLQPPKRAGDPSCPLLSYSDIKGAATVAQACSVVFSIWREGFNPKYAEDDRYISFAVLKNRMGNLSQIDCGFDGLTGSVTELDDAEIIALRELRNIKEKTKEDDSKGSF